MSQSDSLVQHLQQENEVLRREVSSLKNALNSLPDYAYTKDLEGRYTFVNKRVVDLFGQPAENILGKHDIDFFLGSELDDIQNSDFSVMSKGLSVEVEERNVLNSNGEARYYRSTKTPLYDHLGEIVGMFGVSSDITEQKRVATELQENRDLLNTIFDNIDACIYLKDKDFRFSYVNQKTEDVFGMSLDEIVGKRGEEILPADIAELFHASDKLVFTEKKQQALEEVVGNEDGSSSHFWSIKVPITDDRGDVCKMIGFSTDITELAKLRCQLKDSLDYERKLRIEQQSLASTDALTSLSNRLKLDSTIEQEFARLQRYHGDMGLIIVDVDNFKQVNDNHGHQLGDQVLKRFSEILRDNVRKTDVLGRWGGEEFLILCPDTDMFGTERLAEKLRQSVENADFAEDINVTASFGVAAYKEGDNASGLIARADARLYRAKDKGRNSVVSDKD